MEYSAAVVSIPRAHSCHYQSAQQYRYDNPGQLHSHVIIFIIVNYTNQGKEKDFYLKVVAFWQIEHIQQYGVMQLRKCTRTTLSSAQYTGYQCFTAAAPGQLKAPSYT